MNTRVIKMYLCLIFILFFLTYMCFINFLLIKNIFRQNYTKSEKFEGKRELVLLQMIFRHGHRAPFISYPTNPHSMMFWKEGKGSLTKIGRLQNYLMGYHLQKRYSDFISTDPEEVEMISTHASRSQFSSYSFISGLYLPKQDYRFAKYFPWQPITGIAPPSKKGQNVIAPGKCQLADKEQKRFQNSKLANDTKNQFQNLYDFWTYYSGRYIDDWFVASDLGKTLRSQKKYNLSVPDWGLSYWNELKFQSGLAYFFHFGTKTILRLRIGVLLKHMMKNIKEKIHNKIPKKRVFVYASHGSQLAQILLLLNQYNFEEPPMASTLVLELWKENGNSYLVRWLYFNSSSPEHQIDPPNPLYFKECGGEFCFLSDFINITKPFIPEYRNEECAGIVPIKVFQPLEQVCKLPSVVSSSMKLLLSSESLFITFALFFIIIANILNN